MSIITCTGFIVKSVCEVKYCTIITNVKYHCAQIFYFQFVVLQYLNGSITATICSCILMLNVHRINDHDTTTSLIVIELMLFCRSAFVIITLLTDRTLPILLKVAKTSSISLKTARSLSISSKAAKASYISLKAAKTLSISSKAAKT